MKDLSNFIRNEFAKKQLFENYIFIDSNEGIDNVINSLNLGIYSNIIFKNSVLKNHFIDQISIARPGANIINCNCSVESYFDNQFDNLIIFNNVGRCKHQEIIEDINNYKEVIKIC